MKANNNSTLPSINLLYQWYNEFNSLYFSNQLPFVKIEYSDRKRAMGDWSHRYNRLRISNQFIRVEREYQSTLIHEMIHIYQTCVLGIRGSHNYTFKSKMNEINFATQNYYNIDTRFRGEVNFINSRANECILLSFRDSNNRQCFVKTNDKYLDREVNKLNKWRYKDIKALRVNGGIVSRLRQRSVNNHRYYVLTDDIIQKDIMPYITKNIQIAV